MQDTEAEHLEERILALEAHVSSQNGTIRSLRSASALSGLLSGRSLWDLFLIEADRQANIQVPVQPIPVPPRPPDLCWDDYQAALRAARTRAEKLEAVASYNACKG